MTVLKRYKFNIAILLFLTVLFAAPFAALTRASSSEEELAEIKKKFGAVLKLDGNSAREINAIANLMKPTSGIMSAMKKGMIPVDLTGNSGEFCMLEPNTRRYMIHFSDEPEKTTEDILYFINPETFKANGLEVKNLPPLPKELGKMKPFQWYYYDGKSYEPHHGGNIGREFLVMAIDVK